MYVLAYATAEVQLAVVEQVCECACNCVYPCESQARLCGCARPRGVCLLCLTLN